MKMLVDKDWLQEKIAADPNLEVEAGRLHPERPEQKTPREVVDEQAEDEGLWFVARTAPEAYLQQELRRLHAAVEADALRAAEIARLCEEVAELQEREEGFLCALRRIADHEDARDSIKAIAYSELSRT